MKVKSILDSDFEYINAANTDVAATWEKHGFKSSRQLSADTILENIQMNVNQAYKPDDPLRWAYHCGMLMAEVRELVYIINLGR
jgi:FtsP/CotA-like multicopper oxidase with cupredoxin domain